MSLARKRQAICETIFARWCSSKARRCTLMQVEPVAVAKVEKSRVTVRA